MCSEYPMYSGVSDKCRVVWLQAGGMTDELAALSAFSGVKSDYDHTLRLNRVLNGTSAASRNNWNVGDRHYGF